MAKNYFDSFPVISYSNVFVRDITRRGAIAITTLSDPRSRLPLELKPGTRPDVVASKYYKDPNATWMVYLSTNVIDPTWGWYLDDEKLTLLAEARFGSKQEAERRTRRYVTNWASHAEIEMTPAGWSVLTDAEREYWSPNFGTGGAVLSYSRRRDDWSVTTNRIIDVTLESSNGAFATGERAYFVSANAVIGNCEVTWSNSTHVYAQHVSGNTSTLGSTLTGVNSSATALVSNSVVILQNIPTDIESYWEPESEWSYLVYENEKKREVRVLDSRYASEAWTELKQVLND